MLKVEVIGNLGADVQIHSESGNSFASMRVAHTDKWTDASGQEHSETTWVDCIINDVNSKVLPYLKQGVKVFVRGNARTRVYSSPKDRMMKAGISVSVWEIELCGGSSDEVPRELIDPATAELIQVAKAYYPNSSKRDYTFVDRRGAQYYVDKDGWLHAALSQSEPMADAASEQNAQSTQVDDTNESKKANKKSWCHGSISQAIKVRELPSSMAKGVNYIREWRVARSIQCYRWNVLLLEIATPE